MHNSPFEARPPDRFDTSGIRGSAKETLSATRPNSSSIPPIRGEWKAWLTRSRLVLAPRCSHTFTSSATASSSPEITTEPGAFTAANATRPSQPSSAVNDSSTSSSGAPIAAIAPPCGSAPISRPRAATSRQASSNEKTPATCAAASSPTEWPIR